MSNRRLHPLPARPLQCVGLRFIGSNGKFSRESNYDDNVASLQQSDLCKGVRNSSS